MSKEKTKPQPLSEKEASRVVGGVGGPEWAQQAKDQYDENANQNAGGE